MKKTQNTKRKLSIKEKDAIHNIILNCLWLLVWAVDFVIYCVKSNWPTVIAITMVLILVAERLGNEVVRYREAKEFALEQESKDEEDDISDTDDMDAIDDGDEAGF